MMREASSPAATSRRRMGSSGADSPISKVAWCVAIMACARMRRNMSQASSGVACRCRQPS